MSGAATARIPRRSHHRPHAHINTHQPSLDAAATPLPSAAHSTHSAHSTIPAPTLLPRAPTSPPHATLDVAAVRPTPLQSLPIDDLSRFALPVSVDKVDSRPRTAASTVKSRAHSRLASFGRIRSRGSVQQQPPPLPTSQISEPYLQSSERTVDEITLQGETYRVQDPSVLLSDARSHKRSETSILSASSSETALSEDVKYQDSLTASSPEPKPRPSFLAPRTSSAGNSYRDDEKVDPAEQYADLISQRQARSMHQTSSRLLRMTEDDRPFTRDFKDLFSTLMVSLPLVPHRVRFSRIEHTFTTEEAITNLGSLKFSQSNRMPDPKDPSRIVTTTTTTTFSMAKEMARSVCMRFLEARFVESVENKTDFNSRGSVWQLTPKGLHILSRFCQRNGIHQRHVNDVLDSPRNTMQLVILERDSDTDKVNHEAATINVLFRRFAGDTGPNLKSHSSSSDSDSLNDYQTGYIGVKMIRSRRTDKDAPYTFTGKSAFDWLMDCCTVVDKREVFDLANLFLQHGLIEPAGEERNTQQPRYSASKHSTYAITQKGMRVAGWVTSPNGSVNGDATIQQRTPNGITRDSNTNRMTIIIRDPALRLLFREYLRETHCEENLAFYVEVKGFLNDYEQAKRGTSPPKLDVIRETLASAYSLYNAFLAPGSPCELNIDHNLRNALAGRMTRAVGEDEQMVRSLDEVASLFDQAQSSVFKLMASDSVPKFSREPKYASILRERNLESMLANASIS